MPISEDDSTLHTGALLASSLRHPHPNHMQILLMEPSKSISTLTILASSTPNTLVQTIIFSHMGQRQSLRTSLLAFLLVLIQSIPYRGQKYIPLQKPISSCHSLLSPPNNILLHWGQDPNLHHGLKNLPHLFLAPTWADFPLLCSFFTMFQPLRCSCCCFNPPSIFLTPGPLYCCLLCMECKPPDLHMTPSLHSGLSLNVTSSEGPFRTILSKIALAHSLTPYAALFFPGALNTTYHIMHIILLFTGLSISM